MPHVNSGRVAAIFLTLFLVTSNQGVHLTCTYRLSLLSVTLYLFLLLLVWEVRVNLYHTSYAFLFTKIIMSTCSGLILVRIVANVCPASDNKVGSDTPGTHK